MGTHGAEQEPHMVLRLWTTAHRHPRKRQGKVSLLRQMEQEPSYHKGNKGSLLPTQVSQK
ncbi:MAG: hypothetical protein WBF38_06910 [Nitrosotalea sp.]